MNCQFCQDGDFDLIGLKSHLMNGDCPVFECTETIHRIWSLPPEEKRESFDNSIAEAFAEGYRMIESAFCHVSHGGPTRAEAQKFLDDRRDLKVKADAITGGCTQ
jgi:hypothetical protein